ncbi:MAG: GNAT family N-acetyltransferase [Henriciella sp.]|nr:GNAT family N-acetyltransferase [Henriciella sp.]
MTRQNDEPHQSVDLGLADSARMANVHRAAFSGDRAWSAQQFEDLLNQTSIRARGIAERGAIQAFVLFQIAVDQVEILTIATAPSARRQGFASALLADTENRLMREGVVNWWLEVAEDNLGAVKFYQSLGFKSDGRRPNYYKRLEGNRVDAILMSKPMARQAAT